ncbi:MAG: FG-GAP repeat protein [Muribaculaceae bacterium]|nr:FG-GAP repeat protein [Muribaculaceae bacterium]
MKCIGLFLLSIMPLCAMSQEFVTRGMSVEEIVPENCEVQTATGDLNKDGLADVVVLATSKNEENMKVRDDGYTYNFNQPVLAIYFATPSRGYEFWKKYEDIIPYSDSEVLFIEVSISVTDRGVLKIDTGSFASAGSWSNSNYTYLFRYQQGDFYLIGSEQSEMARNTGIEQKVSNNYLTHKRLSTMRSVMADVHVKPTQRWSNLPREPLKRLGSFTLD